MEEIILNLSDENKKEDMINNNFFKNHFTVHLMLVKRNILKNYLIETNYINEEKVIELFNNSEMEYDMLKKMIIKNNTSLERTNKNLKNIEYKMIKIISNILKFDDDIISFLKTII